MSVSNTIKALQAAIQQINQDAQNTPQDVGVAKILGGVIETLGGVQPGPQAQRQAPPQRPAPAGTPSSVGNVNKGMPKGPPGGFTKQRQAPPAGEKQEDPYQLRDPNSDDKL